MSSKTLIRTGSSLVSRLFLSNPILHQQKPNLGNQFVSHGREIINPQLFPSLSRFQTSLDLPQNDTASISRLANQAFLHPFGLPSLPFFLPEGDSSDESMLLLPKRTFQPSTIRRKRNHGFFARY
ncbi:hypothetical protein Tsubulata_028725 [Turnera subulata]|uniref:Uncharacterized protein n=1 Tax=Turnera subulata TaxID=218843 RepID=A0A9Q0GLI2_9ROSI|nr:hypothetical protein Tsubulata_028725 [Turnera subulata]